MVSNLKLAIPERIPDSQDLDGRDQAEHQLREAIKRRPSHWEVLPLDPLFHHVPPTGSQVNA